METSNTSRCTLQSSQLELEEAFMLYELNKAFILLIHVFLCIPEHPRMPRPGEDKSIYSRGVLVEEVVLCK